MRKRIKQNFHWIIAAIVFLETVVFGGLINSASVYIIPISEGLGVSRASYAAALVPYSIVSCIANMTSGYFLRRFGYKRSALTALVLVAAAQVVMGMADSLLMYGLGKALFAMGYGICFTAGAVWIVKDWFHKHQGLVLGAVSMSSGLGGSLMTILQSILIEKYDWRVSNLVTAAITAAIVVLFLLISDKPEQRGLQPFGFGEKREFKQKAGTGIHDWSGYTMKELLRRPSFYLMNFCVLASCTCLYMTSQVAVAHFRHVGFSAGEASAYQSMIMLVVAGAKLIGGGLCDRFGTKPVMLTCMGCGILGQGLLGITTDPALCYVGAGLFAVGLCMTALMIPLIAMPLFGYRACMTANGIFLSMASLATIIANPLSNALCDRLGSYMPGFRAAALINVGITGLYLLLYALCKRDKQQYLAREAAAD